MFLLIKRHYISLRVGLVSWIGIEHIIFPVKIGISLSCKGFLLNGGFPGTYPVVKWEIGGIIRSNSSDRDESI